MLLQVPLVLVSCFLCFLISVSEGPGAGLEGCSSQQPTPWSPEGLSLGLEGQLRARILMTRPPLPPSPCPPPRPLCHFGPLGRFQKNKRPRLTKSAEVMSWDFRDTPSSQ